MYNLLIDIFLSSTTIFKTSFIVFDFKNNHHFLYIILTGILTSIYTLNLYNFIIVVFLYYMNKKLIKLIRFKEILYIVSYIILFNKNITITSFITLILLILFNKFVSYD